MDAECARIKHLLEDTYDIPFSVVKEIVRNEPVFILSPEDPGKELFSVRVSFRNRLRLNMDFVPHKYSVSFVNSMGDRPAEARSLFADYAKLLQEKQAKGQILVNEELINLENVSSWPTKWNSLSIHYMKFPVSIDTESDYGEMAIEWGSLMMGMILSLAEIVSVRAEREPENTEGYAEGSTKITQSMRYERNPLNRKLCLAAKGYDCAICGFNFEKAYGEIGRQFIHVHHIVPVSQLGKGYIINPILDLIPVCPNCHAMLHRKNPPFTPEELRTIRSVS